MKGQNCIRHPLTGSMIIAFALLIAIGVKQSTKHSNQTKNQRKIAQTSPRRADFNRTIWTANALHQINSTRDYGVLALLQLANQILPNTTHEDLPQIRTLLNRSYERYKATVNAAQGNGKTSSDALSGVKTALNIAGTLLGSDPKIKVGSEVLRGVLEWGNGLYTSHETATGRTQAQNELPAQMSRLQNEATRILEGSWTTAHHNAQSAEVIDSFTIQLFRTSVLDEGQIIIHNNPDFVDHKILEAMIAGWASDGTVQLRGSQLQDLAQNQMESLRIQMDQSLERNKQLQAKETPISSPSPMSSTAKLREPDLTLTLQASRSSIYVLSTLIGFSDPAAARRVSALGYAGADLLESISHYNQAISGASALSSAMSGAILTGNLVGTGLSLASALSGAPSSDQLILQELAEIRKEIAELGKQMHERFDRIDASLNELYAKMQQSFADLSLQVAAGREDLGGIQRQLMDLQSQLSSSERRTYQAINAAAKRDLLHIESLCFEMENQLRSTPLPLTVLKNDCVTHFRDYGAVTSRDPLSSRDQAASLDFSLRRSDFAFAQALQSELAYPVESNLKLLAHVASLPLYGNEAMSNFGNVANPVEWAQGAKGYIRLLTANWNRLGKILPLENTQALLTTGQELENYSKSLATQTTSNTLSGNEPFFLKLLENYKRKSLIVGALIKRNIDNRFAVRFGNYPFGSYPLAEDPEKSDGGFVPLSNLNIYDQDETPDANRNESTTPKGLVVKAFPEMFSHIPNLYKFAHQVGVGHFAYNTSVGVYWGTSEKEECTINDQCQLFLQLYVGFNGADGGKQNGALSLRTYKFKAPYLGKTGLPRASHVADVWRALAKRMESYASYEDFLKDVDLIDEFVAQPQVNRGNLDSKKILQDAKNAQNTALATYARELNTFAMSDEVLSATTELTVAKALLETFLSIGLPETLRASDPLQSALYGTDALIDLDRLTVAFRSCRPNALSELALHFDTAANRRIESFEKALLETLKTVHQAEALPMVRDTLQQLTLLRDLQLAARPPSRPGQPAITVSEAMKRAQAELTQLMK